jgi:hypothetical protein
MVPLVIIYNHRFDQNIEKLNKIYGDRFSTIYHLVPFYDGDLPNVIPVFENSFYFQGYVPQCKHIIEKLECDHYLFIGDDLILNPKINEDNVIEELGLNKGNGFLPWYWGMLSDISMEWPNLFQSINAFYLDDMLLHHAPKWQDILPKRENAIEIFNKYHFKTGKLRVKALKGKNNTYNYPRFKITQKNYFNLLRKRRRSLPYPLLAAYSDIFVVSKPSLEKFSEYCELFRQMRLWVECALPTAMLLSHDNVLFEKDSKWKGTTYWADENIEEMISRFERLKYNYSAFESDMADNELYVHPVKLSKWK